MSFALVQHFAWVCGFYGMLLAIAGLLYDRRTSPRIRLMFALLVVALVAGLSAVLLADSDLMCRCDACSQVQPYTALWWFLGCWL